MENDPQLRFDFLWILHVFCFHNEKIIQTSKVHHGNKFDFCMTKCEGIRLLSVPIGVYWNMKIKTATVKTKNIVWDPWWARNSISMLLLGGHWIRLRGPIQSSHLRPLEDLGQFDFSLVGLLDFRLSIHHWGGILTNGRSKPRRLTNLESLKLVCHPHQLGHKRTLGWNLARSKARQQGTGTRRWGPDVWNLGQVGWISMATLDGRTQGRMDSENRPLWYLNWQGFGQK